MSTVVSTDWLAERLDDPAIVILDASWHMPAENRDARAEFAAAHIPGAGFFDIDQISDHTSPLPHMLPSPQEFATAVRRLGVEPTSQVIVYDTIGLMSAARAWWEFRTMGHRNVAVLDGGLPKWGLEGRPVETGWHERAHGEFKAHFEPKYLTTLDQMRTVVADRVSLVVDARAASRFRGEAPEPRAGLRAGHMPGAHNVPWSKLVVAGTLAPVPILQAAFKDAGVDIDRPIVTTCGSGISAAVLTLALAQMGRDAVSVYDGSWTEWGGLEDTPVVTGD